MSLHSEITYTELQKIPEIVDIEEINKRNFKKGDIFLFGENIINQKYNKYPGDNITIYEIAEISSTTCSYFPKIFKIKKEIKNA